MVTPNFLFEYQEYLRISPDSFKPRKNIPVLVSIGDSILGDPGAVCGGRKKIKRARKKIRRRKVKNENRSPWDSSLNRPVPKPFKVLACDWAQKYFCAQSCAERMRNNNSRQSLNGFLL